jgi:hypothetical protein
VVAQLRGVLAAEQSTEVAQVDQDQRVVGPEVADAEALSLRFRQGHRAKLREQIGLGNDA